MAETNFQTEFTVTYPECDMNNNLRLSGLMRHVQQIGGAHLDHLGLSYHRMAADGFVLLLAKEGLAIRRMPKGGERVTLRTAPRRPKGAVLLRDCTFLGEDGEELVFAETTWVAADTKCHRILRPKDIPYDFLESLEEREYTVTAKRVKEPKNIRTIGTRVVRYSDLDCNHHLTNAVYADIVCDFLPYEVISAHVPKTFFVHFQHEAAYEEELTIRVGEQEECGFVVIGVKPSGETCFTAMAEF